MKNILKTASLFILIILLNACTKEDEKQIDTPIPTIIGKWEFSKKISYNKQGQEEVSDYVNQCISLKDNILLEANNSYVETFSRTNCQPEINKTTYGYENNELKLENFSYKLKILSLTGNELKIQYLYNSSVLKAGEPQVYLLIKKE
ncbi:lipocalin family protein [Flavobacterium oreochromis]|uniref:Lipocalin-like domain-containing protein n=2 Tax=Flavobacterium TaxID=237 RepID=A0A246GAQ4_9FLAO|nr:lipocalin family protein [Flavobacterium oreochromis]OWP77192.1 hypothetical protein BWK62_08010 [Flavobacterium oreochromis]OWP77491.1 hypothetical protein BWG23_04975 [Flavobacterium oreochromis]POR27552.1 hypothetical protein BWK58_04430 [Flavobacterium columnare]QYS87681.1 lipocalin family protein [Flavobacterium oreochromis]